METVMQYTLARDYREALRLVGNEPERRYLALRLEELSVPDTRS
jgi:hypothetical protein